MKKLIKNVLIGLGAFYIVTEIPFVIFLFVWVFFAWWGKQIEDKHWRKRWNEDFPVDGGAYFFGTLAGPILYLVASLSNNDSGLSILFPNHTFKFQSPLVVTKNEDV